MPCYNARKTLPLALASLLVQTHEDWECVLVDDGSTDDPYEVVEAAGDPRIRYIRLPENRGRGGARQVALEQARGEFLCMLDADDWWYPEKLTHQLAVMEAEPDLALVSSPMAMVDRSHQLIGIRRLEQGRSGERYQRSKPIKRLTSTLPVAYAPSMIRMDVARQVKFDAKLIRSEDSDYLFQILQHHPYALLEMATYVYTEHANVRLDNVRQAYHYKALMLWKYRREFPLAAIRSTMGVYAKWIIYEVAFCIGLGSSLVALRTQEPTSLERNQYQNAYQTVCLMCDQLFKMA
jgi:glycosyltransferase involved in cell wall biosynthesis